MSKILTLFLIVFALTCSVTVFADDVSFHQSKIVQADEDIDFDSMLNEAEGKTNTASTAASNEIVEKTKERHNDARFFVTIGGLIIGLLMGIVVQRSKFCMSSAFTFIKMMGDFMKFKSYMVALLVAILGVHLLTYIEIPAANEAGKETMVKLLDPAMASQPSFLPFAENFNLLGFVVGGYIFGIGIVFAGGCASRILVRAGEGNLGSFLSLLTFAIAAGTAISGHILYYNFTFLQSWSTSIVSSISSAVGIGTNPDGISPRFSIPELTADLFNMPMQEETYKMITWIVIAAFAVFLTLWIILTKSKDDFWGWKWPLTGIVMGLLVVGGWYITSYANAHYQLPNPFTAEANQEIPVAINSLTFSNPNYLALDFLMNSQSDPEGHPYTLIDPAEGFFGVIINFFKSFSMVGFGIASVFGAIIGSFLAALFTNSFNWVAPPNSTAFLSHIIGGILMGWGGVLSMGCNIGQGLSGFSVLGLGAVITVIFIILGSWTSLWIREKFEI